MDHHSTIKSELLVRTRALPARVRNQSMTKADCLWSHIMSHILWSENSQSHELSANKFNISIQNCRQQITSPERRQHNQVVYIQNWWLKKRVISMAVNLLHLKINIEIFNLTVMVSTPFAHNFLDVQCIQKGSNLPFLMSNLVEI